MSTAAQKPTTLKLDPATRERVQRLAEARQRTPHWLLLEAVRQYVEREEKQEQLRRDAQKAWEDYEMNGLHLSAEEADAWLAQLEAGQDREPPQCHA